MRVVVLRDTPRSHHPAYASRAARPSAAAPCKSSCLQPRLSVELSEAEQESVGCQEDYKRQEGSPATCSRVHPSGPTYGARFSSSSSSTHQAMVGAPGLD